TARNDFSGTRAVLFRENYATCPLLHLKTYTSVREELHTGPAYAPGRNERLKTKRNPKTIVRVTSRERDRCWSSGTRSAAETNRNVPAENARPRGSQATPAPRNRTPSAMPIGVSRAVTITYVATVRRSCPAATRTARAGELAGILWILASLKHTGTV